MSRRRQQGRPRFTAGEAAKTAIEIVTAFRESVPEGEAACGRFARELIKIDDDEAFMATIGRLVGYFGWLTMTFAEDSERAGGRGWEWLSQFSMAAEGQ